MITDLHIVLIEITSDSTDSRRHSLTIDGVPVPRLDTRIVVELHSEINEGTRILVNGARALHPTRLYVDGMFVFADNGLLQEVSQ